MPETTTPTTPNMDDLYSRNPGSVSASAPTQANVTKIDTSRSGNEAVAAADGSVGGYESKNVDFGEGSFAQNRLSDITRQESPLMQRARQEGYLSAARRGLGNSSIAAGASMGAMVDRALPIALQDASTQASGSLSDQAAANTARQFTAQQQNVASLENARASNEAAMQNAQLTAQTNLANTEAENKMRSDVLSQNAELNRQFLAGTQANDLASIQGKYQQLIAANQSASQLYDAYFSSIAQVMANNQLAPDRVAQSIKIQQSMLESGLRMIDQMNTIDLGSGGGGTGGGTGGTDISIPEVKTVNLAQMIPEPTSGHWVNRYDKSLTWAQYLSGAGGSGGTNAEDGRPATIRGQRGSNGALPAYIQDVMGKAGYPEYRFGMPPPTQK